MHLIEPIKEALRRHLPRGNVTYSQCGEDRIIDFVIQRAGLMPATYIDAGCWHPTKSNNSYLLYRRGCHGVCIDPNASLAPLYRQYRPRDMFIAAALSGTSADKVKFTFFDEPTLNSADAETSALYTALGYAQAECKEVPAVTLLQCKDYLKGRAPTVLMLDVEGYEHSILSALDFRLFRPEIICFEAVKYNADRAHYVSAEVAEILSSENYIRYAVTYINEIWLDVALFNRLRLIV